MPPLASATFSRAVDHTLLDPSAGAAAVDRLCDEAAFHEFVAVCVLLWSVGRCAARLAGCASRVATVVSFPHGMDATPAKCEAARGAAAAGADELDVVMAWGALDDDPAAVKEDLA